MASNGVEEEDMPELESLSSSESVDEDAEDEDEREEMLSSWSSDARLVDRLRYPSLSTTGKIAVQWLCKDWAAIEKQMHIISLYTLSPFLYGCSYQSEKWLQWLCQTQLLTSDKHFTTGLLDQKARSVVDVFEHAYHTMMDWMREGWPPNRGHPVGVTYMLDLFQEVKDCRELWEAMDKVKKNVWFAKVVKDSMDQSCFQDGTERTFDCQMVACLYILTNTAECVYWYVEKREQDSTTPLGRFTQYYDRKVGDVDTLQNEGMSYFSCRKYKEAVAKYDSCIQKYPFCSNIFLQRCLCFLELKKPIDAVSDGLRAYHLDRCSQMAINVYMRTLQAVGEHNKATVVKMISEMRERVRISNGRKDIILHGKKLRASILSKSNEDVTMDIEMDLSESDLGGILSTINDCNTSLDLDSTVYALNSFSHQKAVNGKTDPCRRSEYLERVETIRAYMADLDLPIQRGNSHSMRATKKDSGHAMRATRSDTGHSVRASGGASVVPVHGGKARSASDKKKPTLAAENPPTLAAENPPTLAAEKAPTLATEKPPTLAAEKPPTLAAENPPTLATEKPPTLAAEKPPTLAAEKPPTLAAEKPPTLAAEKPSPCNSLGLSETERGVVAQDKMETTVDSKLTSTELKSAPIVCVDVCVQTECSAVDKGVVTDPLPPVETFKERYEGLVVEKKNLSAKLEESEDRRVQLHKEHKRELERVQKKVRQEVQDESNAKIMSLEAQLLDERTREQQGKKEQTEQIKALKLEVKAHKEKADKCRKDLTKKEHELETRLVQFQEDMDKGYTDKKRMEDRMRSLVDSGQKALARAMSAEVELVSFKREITLKGLENDLIRIETISQNIVSTGEFHQQLSSFKEKFKAALSTYQTAIDEVVKQLKMGRELSTLTVPEPCMPTAPTPPSASLQHPAMRSMLMPLMPQGVPRLLPQGGVPPVAPQGVLQGPSHQGLAQQAMPQGILQTAPQGLSQIVLQSMAQSSSKSVPQGSPQSMGQGIPQGSAQSVPQSLPQGVSQGLIQQGLRATQGPGISRGLSQGLSQQELLQGISQQGLFQGMPPQGLSQQGPSQGISQQGLFHVMPQQGLSQGMPQQGLSQGMPQQGLSQQGPSQGISQQGLFQGMPQQGPSQGISQQGLFQGMLQDTSRDLLQSIPNGMPFGTNSVYSSLPSMMPPLLANMPSSHVSPLVMPIGHNPSSAPILSTQTMASTAPVFQDPSEPTALAFVEQEELTTTPRKKGLDRILQNLAPYYPQLSREDCRAILNEIRKQTGNALSGCSLDYLSVQVKAKLDAANPESTNARLSMATQQPVQQPKRPLFTGPSAPVGEYDDEGCVICYEEMGQFDTTKLNCGHCFHTNCIRSWLKEQRTCPTCRNHALLTDDYPYLDQTVQKAH